MRMDVEGHEVEVLNGLINSIDEIKKLPMIILKHIFQDTIKNIISKIH